MEDKKLKSIRIDLENNIFELNGEDIRNASKVEIGYSNGTWTVLTERTYSFTGRLLCPDKEHSNQDAKESRIIEREARDEKTVLKM